MVLVLIHDRIQVVGIGINTKVVYQGGIGTDTTMVVSVLAGSTLLILVKHGPLPQHCYQVLLYAYDNFEIFNLCCNAVKFWNCPLVQEKKRIISILPLSISEY